MPQETDDYKTFLLGKVDEIQQRARAEAAPYMNELVRLAVLEPPQFSDARLMKTDEIPAWFKEQLNAHNDPDVE